MKTSASFKSFSVFITFIISFGLLSAQGENPRKMTVTIKSTVECDLCKKNVEKQLSKLKGIRKVSADFKTHEITVTYNSKKVNIDQIKKAIADIGYDADDVPANNRMNQLLKHKKQNNQ